MQLKKYEDYISVNRLSTNSWQVFFSKKHVSICVAIRHDFPEKKRFVNLPENSDAMDQAEENALWTFGNGWYGRCLITGEEGKLTCRKTIYTKPGLTGWFLSCRLGHGDTNSQFHPQRISKLPKALRDFSLGTDHAAAVSMDMEVYVWGKASLLGEVQHVPYLKVRTEKLDWIWRKLGFAFWVDWNMKHTHFFPSVSFTLGLPIYNTPYFFFRWTPAFWMLERWCQILAPFKVLQPKKFSIERSSSFKSVICRGLTTTKLSYFYFGGQRSCLQTCHVL